MQTHVRNPFTEKVYRLIDLLDTCSGNDLDLILFKDIEQDPTSPINKTKAITADDRYPIILMPTSNNKYSIIDGNHRYLRMKYQKKTASIAFVVDARNFAQIKDSWDSFPKVGCASCEE